MAYSFYCKQCGDEATILNQSGGKKQSVCYKCKAKYRRRKSSKKQTKQIIVDALEQSTFLLAMQDPFFFSNLTYDIKPARNSIKNK